MKKITIIFLIGLLSLSFTKAQAQGESKFELAPVVGYQFGGHVNFYEGEFRIQDGMNYGLYANVLVRQNHRIEFGYSMMSTKASFRPYGTFLGDYNSWDGDVNVNYFLIGSHSEMPVSEKVILFGGASLGATYMSVNTPGMDDVWRFAVGIGAGMKVMFTDRVGIRLQGRLLMPMYFAGVGFYAGIGTGGASSGLSLNTGSVIFQGDFQGGLVFGF